MSKPKQPDAKQQYAAQLADARTLLELVGSHLRQNVEPNPNWGHVGDMAELTHQLLDAAIMLSGQPNDTATRERLARYMLNCKRFKSLWAREAGGALSLEFVCSPEGGHIMEQELNR